MKEYSKRLVEVDEILKHMSKKDLEKIPKEVLSIIRDNKDSKYIWNYDKTKSLKNQNINKDTISILSYLNMEYLLNSEQKDLIMKIHNLNKIKKDNK